MLPSRNVYGTLIPNEVDDANVDNSDDVKSKYIFCSYAATQQVLLRASAAKKIEFLYDLFTEIKDNQYMRMIHNLLLKYFMGKLPKYLSTLDRSGYINDINVKDNDRLLNATDLDIFLTTTLSWYKYLENEDLKLGIFLSFLSVCGNNVIREVILRMKRGYKIDETNKIVEKQDGANQVKKSRSSRFQSFAFASDSFDDVEVKMNFSDPDVQLIYKRRKEWRNMIDKYRTKVEQSIGGPEAAKKATGSKSKTSAKTTDKKSKGGKSKKDNKSKKKGKSKGSNKSSKKGKSTKGGKAGKKKVKPEIDFIQLLPIWITMNIFKYLDAKTLKIIKNVNKYWEFVVTCLSQEEKGRKKLDSWIESLQDEFHLKDIVPVYPLSIKPQFRFHRHEQNIIACDPKVHEAIQALDGVEPQKICTSVLTTIANNPGMSFRLPVNNLLPCERMVPPDCTGDQSKYIHAHPNVIHFDSVTTKALPINEIHLVSEYVEDFEQERLSSFEYRPSAIEDRMQKSFFLDSHSTEFGSRLLPLNRAPEYDRMMSIMIEKSIANFQKSTLRAKMQVTTEQEGISLTDFAELAEQAEIAQMLGARESQLSERNLYST